MWCPPTMFEAEKLWSESVSECKMQINIINAFKLHFNIKHYIDDVDKLKPKSWYMLVSLMYISNFYYYI